MLWSGCLVNGIHLAHTMSHQNLPSPHRKKLPKHPVPVTRRNSVNKYLSTLADSADSFWVTNKLTLLSIRLNKVTSTSSYVEDPDDVQDVNKNGLPDYHPHFLLKSKASSNPMKPARKSNDTISEDEVGSLISNIRSRLSASDFNSKKQPVNVNSSSQSINNRKMERESALVGMIGKQLYLAESQMQKMHLLMSKADEQLKEKDQEVGRLKRKVREWEAKFKHQESVHRKELQREQKQVEDSEYLYRRCLMLEHKIYEMEKFLADYGLVWIGDSEGGSDSPGAKSKNYLDTCYHQLMANIEELNLAAGKGEVHVQREKGGSRASFKTSSCMSLKFYKNGLVVQNGVLRPYEDVTTTSFIRDILDGYFPSELQQAYPNGVPFKVEDHRTETFQGMGCGFPGHGHRLGKFHPGGSGMALKQGAAPIGRIQRQNCCSLKPSVPPLFTVNAKSLKSKSFTEPPSPPDILQLRSQILASHNNNCSDSHIQSHINAELGLSSRSEKKRDMATKDAEYHISLRERALKLENRFGFRSPRLTSGSRTSHHSSTDRSSDRMSPSRLESSRSYDGRSRSRSASLPGKRARLSSLSNLRAPSGSHNAVTPKVSDYASLSNVVRKPRATKSATLERNSVAPVLHQVNEPTGKPDEMRLKIRSLNGSTFYLVHLCPDDTVARLYKLLDTCHTKTRMQGYKVVVSGYAPKRLEHLGVSLREYGILRDSVLHVVNDSTM